MHIHTVASLAAASKTYNAIRFAMAGVRAGRKTLFCVPSTDLAMQIEADCRKRGCTAVTAIHTKDGRAGSVVARVTKHFQQSDPERGDILIITMAALERLKYVERKSSWHLIVDELPSPVCHLPISLNKHRQAFLTLLDEQPWNASYTRLSASETDSRAVRDDADNRSQDMMTQTIADAANKLLSPHWHCYALNEQLARFKDGPAGPDGAHKTNTLDFFGLLQPAIFAGFASVTMMGACLHESLLYRYWLTQGVTFLPHPTIKPRFEQYPNGHLVTIQYATDRDWSAKLRDQEGLFETIVSRCKTALNGAPYVYLLNKGLKLEALTDGVQLPHVSHGLNEFQRFHNAMLLSALIPPPAYFGFCSDLMGIDSDEVRTAIYRTAIYQAAMRISIRDLDNTDRKRIQVVDRATAVWLAGLIDQAQIHKLPGEDPAPADRRRVAKPKIDAERTHAHRQKIKQELIRSLDQVNGLDEQNPSHDMLYKKDPVTRNFHLGTVFRTLFDRYGISTCGISVDLLRTVLAELHQDVIAGKDSRRLISPGVYDPSLAEATCKGAANLVSLSGLWLDNDGGDLPPEQFARMLRVPLVIFNSFNSTPAKRRWRVWIPTSHLISAAVHQELIAQICKMLIDRKLYGKRYIAKHPDKPVKHHGFDESKFTTTASFYLPAQAKAGADASFFWAFNWQNDLLNPYQWIDRTINDHREPTVMQPPVPPSDAWQTLDEAKVEKAIANWRAHGAGEGNAGFFKLAVALRHAGLRWLDAEPKLRYEALFAHGPGSAADRIRDLRGYHRKIWAA